MIHCKHYGNKVIESKYGKIKSPSENKKAHQGTQTLKEKRHNDEEDNGFSLYAQNYGNP